MTNAISELHTTDSILRNARLHPLDPDAQNSFIYILQRANAWEEGRDRKLKKIPTYEEYIQARESTNALMAPLTLALSSQVQVAAFDAVVGKFNRNKSRWYQSRNAQKLREIFASFQEIFATPRDPHEAENIEHLKIWTLAHDARNIFEPLSLVYGWTTQNMKIANLPELPYYSSYVNESNTPTNASIILALSSATQVSRFDEIIREYNGKRSEIVAHQDLKALRSLLRRMSGCFKKLPIGTNQRRLQLMQN